MPTFPRQPTYIRNHKERVAAAQDRTRIAIEAGTVPLHPNDARAWRGGLDPRYRLPTIGVNSGAMPGTNPGAVR